MSARKTTTFGIAARVTAAVLLVAAVVREPQHHGTGRVVSIDRQGEFVTIAHDDMPGLMGPMTMRFRLADPGLTESVAKGDSVGFVLRGRGAGFKITSLWPSVIERGAVPPTAESEATPGHHHRSQHGGQVGMAGLIHLEAVVAADGAVRVYVSDLVRKPMALDGTSGSATFVLDEESHTFALAPADTPEGAALTGQGPAIAQPQVQLELELVHDGEDVVMDFVLPIVRGRFTPGLPPACERPRSGSRGAATGLLPVCTLELPTEISAVALASDASQLVVGSVDQRVGVYRLDTGALSHQLADPPEDSRGQKHEHEDGPHLRAPNAVAVRPDGREIVVATHHRLFRYPVDGEQPFSWLPGRLGAVRSLAFSSDAKRLLVSRFYDDRAMLINPVRAKRLRDLVVAANAAGVALSDYATLAAVGTEHGTVAVFDLRAEELPPRIFRAGSRAVRAVGFGRASLAAASADGTLRIWDLAGGKLRFEAEGLSSQYRLVVDDGGERIAVGGQDGVVRMYAVDPPRPIAAVKYHDALITGLAWHRETLVTADSDGRLAVWDTTAKR